MKKSREYLGLSIISIEDGKFLGKVRALIVNPKKSEITAIAVLDEQWYKEVKIISYALLCGIGEYAITIENSSSIVSLSSIPEIEKLLISDIKIIDADVINKSGKFLGKVIEYFIDEKSGKIVSYEIALDENKENVIISANGVLTIGKNILIVVDNISDYFGKDFVPSVEQKKETERGTISVPLEITKPEKEEITLQVQDDVKTFEEPAVEIPTLQPIPQVAQEKKNMTVEAPVAAEIPTPPPVDKKELNISQLFEQRRRKFVLGKIATKDIVDSNGELIIAKDDIVTEEIIEKANKLGKFQELSLNIRQG